MSGSFFNKAKKQFITGIIVIMPLGLTVWILWALFNLIGKRFLPLFKSVAVLSNLPLAAQMFISAFLTLAVIWFVGVWTKNYFGRKILKLFEKMVYKTPFINKIYTTIRKITDTLFMDKNSFKEVALIEYPRKGVYTMVFVTNRADIPTSSGKKFVSVFIPSTPNPTTGYCILLPEDELRVVPITINQAMEFILSAGIIVPEEMDFKDL